jgi:hypothetical protein
MRTFFRVLTLTSIVCAASTSAMAVPVAAPGPEIGAGAVGAAAATLALIAFAALARLKRSRKSKEY